MVQTLKPEPHITQALKRLDGLAEQLPELAEAIPFYRAVLPVLHHAQAKVKPFEMQAQIAQRKIASGQPVLIDEELPLDIGATRTLFLQLCRIIEALHVPTNRKAKSKLFSQFLSPRNQPDSLTLIEHMYNGNGVALRSAAAGQICRAVERNVLDLPSLWMASAEGDWQRVELLATVHRLDAALLSLLAQNSLKPAFRVWARDLAEWIDFDVWQRGDCPVCGSIPLFAEIQGKEGARRLRCGLCGTSWHYPRLRCAFCGNRDYKTLGHITVIGQEEKYRLQTCDSCRGYMKVIVTFEQTPVELLQAEDLVTLDLDMIAADHHFLRITTSSALAA